MNKKRCSCFIAGLMFFILFVASPCVFAKESTSPSAAAEVEKEQKSEELLFKSMVAGKTKEIIKIQEDTDKARERINELSSTLKTVLDSAAERFQRTVVMAKMAKGSPYETRTSLNGFKQLAKEIEAAVQPVKVMLEEVQLRLDTLNILAEEMDKRWADSLGKELRAEVRDFQKLMNTVRSKLKETQAGLSELVRSTEEVHSAIKEEIVLLEGVLPEFWKKFFLIPSAHMLDLDTWTRSAERFQAWGENFPIYFSSQLPVTFQERLDWGGRLFIFWVLIFGLPFFLVRKLTAVRDVLSSRQKRAIFLGWLCTSIALAMLGSFLSGEYRQTQLQLSVVHVLLFYGVMKISWILRSLSVTGQVSYSLRPLFWLFSASVLLQFLNLPGLILGLAWTSMLVLVGLTMAFRKTELRLERAVCILTPVVTGLLLLATVFGWGQLAVLGGQLFALMVIGIQAAIGVSNSLRLAMDRLPKAGFYPVLQGAVVGLGTPLIWLAVVISVFAWLTVYLGSDFVYQKVSTLNLSWGAFSLNFLRIAGLVVIFYLTKSMVVIWNSVMEAKEFKWRNVDPGAASSLQTMGGYVIWIAFALVSMNVLGISLTSLAVIAGGLSVGIGFGLQNLINNFISGIILLFARTIQPGDIIELNSIWGTVRKVNIRNTEVQTFENAMMFIPNSDLISGQLTNWTHRRDKRMRRDIGVGVAYGSDVEKVKRVLEEIAENDQHVLRYPEPQIIFQNFGASSLDFVLRVWIDSIDYAISTQSELREEIDRRFREESIEISFPQMDLHIRPGDGVLRVER